MIKGILLSWLLWWLTGLLTSQRPSHCICNLWEVWGQFKVFIWRICVCCLRCYKSCTNIRITSCLSCSYILICGGTSSVLPFSVTFYMKQNTSFPQTSLCFLFIIISIAALRGSTSQSKAMRSHIKCAACRPRTWRCRQWRWRSHISTQGRNTRPGRGRSSARRAWALGLFGAAGWRVLDLWWDTFCVHIRFSGFTYTAKRPVLISVDNCSWRWQLFFYSLL